MTTVQPSASSASAPALPIPVPPPVTHAILVLLLTIFSLIVSCFAMSIVSCLTMAKVFNNNRAGASAANS